MPKNRSFKRRRLGFETLETRTVMTAEGQSYTLDRVLDVSDLHGAVSGNIDWGDGTTSPATIQNGPAAGAIKFRFDFSLDTSGFFSDVARRSLLQTAADMVSSKFGDSLSPIQPQSGDTWEARFVHPITGVTVSKSNLNIAANEILVYVGARSLGGVEGGSADRGGFTAQSPRNAFLGAVKGRGQPGALANPPTDVAPWGGSITFDSGRNWYFGTQASSLQSNQLDFVSVATHELMHIMGFGTTSVWDSKIVNSTFAGSNAVAVFGNPIPLADSDHFGNTSTIDGRRPTMVQIFNTGERLLPSRLDLAALKDIGWQLIPQTARLLANHTYGDNANLNLGIRLQGASLGIKSQSTSVAITNAPPVLAPIANRTAQAGVALSIPNLGQFTDGGFGMPLASPALSESFTYRVQWGDGTADAVGPATVTSLGSPGQNTVGFFDAAHTYNTPGTYTATVRITDDDGGFAERSLQVVVSPAGRVSLSLDKTSIREDAGPGAAVLTVTRSGTSLSDPLEVALSSSDTSELMVPLRVTIPANQTSTTVSVTAVDDTLFDGTQRVSILPSAANLELVGVSVDVLDYQPLVLTALRLELDEGVADNSSTLATLSIRSAAPTGGVQIQLTATPAGVLNLPASVLIPAGSTQASFAITVLNNDRPSNPRTITINGTGSGVIGGSISLLVRDNDPARWTNPNLAFDIDNSGGLNPLDALALIDEINRRGSRVLAPELDGGLPFVDPNRDGALDPLDVLFVIDQINRR